MRNYWKREGKNSDLITINKSILKWFINVYLIPYINLHFTKGITFFYIEEDMKKNMTVKGKRHNTAETVIRKYSNINIIYAFF